MATEENPAVVVLGDAVDLDSKMSCEYTVVILGADSTVVLGGPLVDRLASVDVEVRVGVSANDTILSKLVNTNIIKAPDNTRRIHPCPAPVAVKIRKVDGKTNLCLETQSSKSNVLLFGDSAS